MPQADSPADDHDASSLEFPERLFERLGSFEIGGEGTRLLELCAATGHMARSFARRGFQVTSIDKSPERIDELKERHAGDETDFAAPAAPGPGGGVCLVCSESACPGAAAGIGADAAAPPPVPARGEWS